MSKRTSKSGQQRRGDGATGSGLDDDPILQRLRRHLEFLGLTRTPAELEDQLSWAMHERPGAIALFEHILGREVAQRL